MTDKGCDISTAPVPPKAPKREIMLDTFHDMEVAQIPEEAILNDIRSKTQDRRTTRIFLDGLFGIQRDKNDMRVHPTFAPLSTAHTFIVDYEGEHRKLSSEERAARYVCMVDYVDQFAQDHGGQNPTDYCDMKQHIMDIEEPELSQLVAKLPK